MSHRLSIKSKLGAEIRRFSLNTRKTTKFDEFKTELERLHALFEVPFFVYYIDPTHGDLLPINNNDNFALAVTNSSLNQPCLKLHLQTKGESWIQNNGSGKKKNFFDNINNLLPLHSSTLDKNRKLHISFPLEDFRQVSSIIDVDLVPETCRRVRLVKHGSDKPLGFYIRDGTSVRVTVKGLEKVPGIFISRLVPGGLAESTGLLSVNDEVLEVNGIEVLGKSLDQVTDMMVANSSNLIITIRPANQRNPPFQYPKLPQQQSFNSVTQVPAPNRSANSSNHQNHRTSTSSNNHHSHSSKQPTADGKSKPGVSLQAASASQSQHANQRIPLNENTPALAHSKSSKVYLTAREPASNGSSEKVPAMRTSQSSQYLGANLAEGEDTSDEEDEVKHHFHEQSNDFNKNNGDGKTVAQESRSNH